jgi:hypothetical protein
VTAHDCCCCVVQVGLVDEVGGLARATDVAKQLAGLSLDPSASITQEWPPRWVVALVLVLVQRDRP